MSEQPGFNPEQPNPDDFIEVTGHDGQKIRVPKNKVRVMEAGPVPVKENVVKISGLQTEPLPSGPGTKSKKKK